MISTSLRSVSFGRAALVAVPMALSACHPQVEPKIPEPASQRPAECGPKAAPVPTEMTMILVADRFLAYVSVPYDGTVRDLDEPRSDFYYSERGAAWKAVPGCERVFSCDVSALAREHSGGFIVKAEFSESGCVPASATFPYSASSQGARRP